MPTDAIDHSPSSARSLIVVGPETAGPARVAGRASRLTSPRPSAAFVVQLIAAAQRVPQARIRRRAEPDRAAALYAAATARTQPAAIERVM